LEIKQEEFLSLILTITLLTFLHTERLVSLRISPKDSLRSIICFFLSSFFCLDLPLRPISFLAELIPFTNFLSVFFFFQCAIRCASLLKAFPQPLSGMFLQNNSALKYSLL